MVIQSKNKRDKEKLYWRKNPAVIISLRSLSKRFSRMANTTFPQYVDDMPEGEYDESFERQQRVNERRRLTTSLDLYLVVAVGVLIAIGLMMVWSTTFYWSDPQAAIFLQQARNAGIGFVIMLVLGTIDYRIW